MAASKNTQSTIPKSWTRVRVDVPNPWRDVLAGYAITRAEEIRLWCKANFVARSWRSIDYCTYAFRHTEDAVFFKLTWHMQFPYRVNIRNITRHRSDEDITGLPAWWCLRNLNKEDWLHDWQGFEFRHEEDAVLFKLTWG